MLDGKKVSAIILGAGLSSRMGGKDKLFARLNSKPLFYWSVLAFEKSAVVDEIIIVLNASNLPAGKRMAAEEGFSKVTAIINGGQRRQDSVQEGLNHVSGDFVLVHDGARPLVSSALIQSTAKKAGISGACIPVIGVSDTIKTAENGFVKETLPREDLRAVQTPQAFLTTLLREAYRKISCDVTDDAQAIELTGGKVSLTEGSYDNIKVTTPSDLELARILIRKQGGIK